MKTTRFLLAASIVLAMAVTMSCDPKNISSSVAETPSSSSVAGMLSDKCGGKEYDPATHFCYVNECVVDPTCPDCTVCYREEKILKKCDGKTYNPELEECLNGNFVACKGQIPRCGGCMEHTTCDGNPSLYKDGTPVGMLCYARPMECAYADGGCGKKEFKAVQIGTQTWMAENLNCPAEGKFSTCYGNDPDNCDKYGRLYAWDAAMAACPSGWHLPSNEEWAALVDYVGKGAGIKLKKDSWGSVCLALDCGGTDKYGFAALPGGYSNNPSDFENIGSTGRWWTATKHQVCNPPLTPSRDELVAYSCSAPTAYIWEININQGAVSNELVLNSSHFSLNSVRCVKD